MHARLNARARCRLLNFKGRDYTVISDRSLWSLLVNYGKDIFPENLIPWNLRSNKKIEAIDRSNVMPCKAEIIACKFVTWQYIFKNILCQCTRKGRGSNSKRVRKSFTEIQLWNHNIGKLFPKRIQKKEKIKRRGIPFFLNFESLSLSIHHFRDDLIALLNTVHTWARVIVFKESYEPTDLKIKAWKDLSMYI